jgi:hypothetical protein
LKYAGVTPRQALEAVCATWFLVNEQPRRFPTRATVQHALANAVLRTAPMRHTSMWKNGKKHCKTKPPGSGPILLLAARLDELSRFAGNLTTIREQRRHAENQAKAKVQAAIDTPFSLAVSELPKRKRGRPKKVAPAVGERSSFDTAEPITPAVTSVKSVVFVPTDPGPRPLYRTTGDLALIEVWNRRNTLWHSHLKSLKENDAI